MSDDQSDDGQSDDGGMSDTFKVEIAGLGYFCVVRNDPDRAGMVLELAETWDDRMLEIFCCDRTGSISLTTRKAGIPVEAVEWLIAKARMGLPTQH